MNLRTLAAGILALSLIFFGCRKDTYDASGTPEFAITGLHDVRFDNTVSGMRIT